MLFSPRSKERGNCPDLQVGKTLKEKDIGLQPIISVNMSIVATWEALLITDSQYAN